MTRTTGRLTALKVARAKRPGMYPDGGGLYLQVTTHGASWVYRYMLHGRARTMGLGPLVLYGLAEARAKALDARRLRHEGIDPIEARHADAVQQRLAAAREMTFRQCAARLIETMRPSWRSSVHASQWETTLVTYADPVIGTLPVASIDTTLVLRALEPIWTTKPETASRLRGRIEAVLDWATARGYRQGENPARWRGHLDKLLPARTKVARVEHHAALPYAALPSFLIALREQQGPAARALEFAILTAARSGEVRGCRWSEIDLIDKVWTIPARRMKGGREHRIPLAPRALVIMREMQAHADDGFVFPGSRPGEAFSKMAIPNVLRRTGRDDATVHGFRSSFRDWAAETTTYPNHVVEQALAHAIGNAVEKAYRRSDLFKKRRKLMGAWATFCTSTPAERGKIISLARER
jgi:integrase